MALRSVALAARPRSRRPFRRLMRQRCCRQRMPVVDVSLDDDCNGPPAARLTGVLLNRTHGLLEKRPAPGRDGEVAAVLASRAVAVVADGIGAFGMPADRVVVAPAAVCMIDHRQDEHGHYDAFAAASSGLPVRIRVAEGGPGCEGRADGQ